MERNRLVVYDCDDRSVEPDTNRRGFLICDLVDQPNIFFGAENITQEDGSPFLDAALAIVKNEGKISMDQAFVVEAWRAPIDQWRFAYMYHQDLALVKKMVQWLMDEGILAPGREAEEPEATTGNEQ